MAPERWRVVAEVPVQACPGAPVGDVRGREQAARQPGVVDVVLFPPLYRRDGPVADFQDRLAYVIAEGESAAHAGEHAERGLRQLHVEPLRAHERWRRTTRRLIGAAVRRIPGGTRWRG